MTSDIKQVWIGPAWIARSEIKQLAGTLAAGERVLAGAGCNHTAGSGAVAVTTQRVVLVSSITTREALVGFPLDQVTSVAATGGLWGGKLTITAAGRVEVAKLAYKDAVKLEAAFREAKTATAQGQGVPVGVPQRRMSWRSWRG